MTARDVRTVPGDVEARIESVLDDHEIVALLGEPRPRCKVEGCWVAEDTHIFESNDYRRVTVPHRVHLASVLAELVAVEVAIGQARALRSAADEVRAGVLPDHPVIGYRDGFSRAARIVEEAADRIHQEDPDE